MFGFKVEPQPPVDRFYKPGTVITFGDYEVRRAPHARPLPGRRVPADRPAGTAGHDLFVGDTLFAGSIGRTDLPGGDYATLIASIRTCCSRFGDEALVHPGHGEPTRRSATSGGPIRSCWSI